MTSVVVVRLNLTESREDLLLEQLFFIYASSLYRNTHRTRFNFSFQKCKWTVEKLFGIFVFIPLVLSVIFWIRM